MVNINNSLQKKIDELIEEICTVNESIPIIVEGQKDESALRKLGAKGLIFRLNTGLSILNFCEEIARNHNEIILLPDWDNKGKQLFKKLIQNFKITTIKVNENFWHLFKSYCSKDILSVEYLNKYKKD